MFLNDSFFTVSTGGIDTVKKVLESGSNYISSIDVNMPTDKQNDKHQGRETHIHVSSCRPDAKTEVWERKATISWRQLLPRLLWSLSPPDMVMGNKHPRNNKKKTSSCFVQRSVVKCVFKLDECQFSAWNLRYMYTLYMWRDSKRDFQVALGLNWINENETFQDITLALWWSLTINQGTCSPAWERGLPWSEPIKLAPSLSL